MKPGTFFFTFCTFWQRAMRPGTVPTSTNVSSHTWTLKMFLPGWRSSLNHLQPHIYFSAFPGRLQPALPDQQGPLHTGDAHQLVPGGESGVDISAIYIKYISNIKNISAIYEKYISHISQEFSGNKYFSEGCSEWVFGLVGGEGGCLLCHRNSGDRITIIVRTETHLFLFRRFSGWPIQSLWAR